MEQFKQFIIQRSFYETHLTEKEFDSFNTRQKKLVYHKTMTSQQLCLKHLLRLGKENTDSTPEQIKEDKFLLKKLMLVLYKEKDFFKKIEEEHSEFLDDLVDQIEHSIQQFTEAAGDEKEYVIRRSEDMAKINLSNPKLQHVFYLMLKGTQKRDTADYDRNEKVEELGSKEYYPLTDFIIYDDKSLSILSPPAEILEIFFEKKLIDDTILPLRTEISKKKKEQRESIIEQLNEKIEHGVKDDVQDIYSSRFSKPS